jgi:hypothetical protein
MARRPSTLDPLVPAETPGFDCFYVYPTTSADTSVNSDLVFDQSETDTVRAQVARFASRCRVFAPVYQSVTLGGLFSAGPEAWEIAYRDVVDAWRSYVVDQNDGRGVVLIGHSQDAGHLARLMEEEIGPDPTVRRLVVSAMLLGTSVPRDGIGAIPACTSASQSGCLVSFSSFRLRRRRSPGRCSASCATVTSRPCALIPPPCSAGMGRSIRCSPRTAPCWVVSKGSTR